MPDTFIIAGSINIDYNVRVTRLPEPGETITGSSFSRAFGGKGANQAVALSRLIADTGKTVVFAGNIGNDADGTQALNNLKSNGIEVHHCGTMDTSTGMAFIEIAENADNRIVVVPGANKGCDSAWAEHQMSQILQEVPDPSRTCCLLQLEIPLPAVYTIIRKCHEAGCMILLDPAPATLLDTDIWPLVNIVTPNQHETRILTGIFPDSDSTARNAAEVMLNWGAGAGAVIIKAGAQGAWYFDADEQLFCPSFKVTAKDTTAAGDVFNAAYSAALGMGKTISEALRFANAAGAICVTGEGAQSAMPDCHTVEELLREDSRTFPRRL